MTTPPADTPTTTAAGTLLAESRRLVVSCPVCHEPTIELTATPAPPPAPVYVPVYVADLYPRRPRRPLRWPLAQQIALTLLLVGCLASVLVLTSG